ncbi:DUF3152 domain-containing protein [Streptomyces sp. NBC_00338]|uniref:DUF3152 domain-containing protein n=1 Tax=Streptomyces sp. NBC_00338 TaxID=2975715 RepID=UPI0022570141|nr:DUF3152 domain-containing protein [Streptomyces sp. NBC_00338]MCX5142736.1 DUF3152 domain-containing protein [Streptomyces sp. NBC_00338]
MRRELIRGVGRHSRKGPVPRAPESGPAEANAEVREGARPVSGSGRRRRPGDGRPGGDADGHTPFAGTPQVRGGHPEQREPGGGWGTGPTGRYTERPAAQARAQDPAPGRPQGPRPAQTPRSPQGTATRPLIPGPRREFVEAFDSPPAPPTAPRGPAGPADPSRSLTDRDERPPASDDDDARTPGEDAREPRSGRGRTFTGIAAAAVTTVLAVVVAGQVAHDSGSRSGAAQAAGVDRGSGGDASRSDNRETPSPKAAVVKPLSYEQKMAKPYPMAPKLAASGKFAAVPGAAKAPGKGHKYRYRIDVENGLGLDSALFAQAVQKTLNDDRSWAHGGDMTFERISTGDPDFVITLASPGTTGDWCAKSGLDTTEDNVSCDSAATERVMINAYRWAQGSSTFGPDKLFAYRQMLINHEVGHRLGHNHVSCGTKGALAPVMQQQTKSLDIDGIKCRPNAWVYPTG